MKIETAIKRIMDSDKPLNIKRMKLQTLAFKEIPGSPNQEKVKKVLDEIGWTG